MDLRSSASDQQEPRRGVPSAEWDACCHYRVGEQRCLHVRKRVPAIQSRCRLASELPEYISLPAIHFREDWTYPSAQGHGGSEPLRPSTDESRAEPSLTLQML